MATTKVRNKYMNPLCDCFVVKCIVQKVDTSSMSEIERQKYEENIKRCYVSPKAVNLLNRTASDKMADLCLLQIKTSTKEHAYRFTDKRKADRFVRLLELFFNNDFILEVLEENKNELV